MQCLPGGPGLRLLARKLGCRYVNSGSFYRAVTWAVLEAGLPLEDEGVISAFVSALEIQCRLEGGNTVLLLNGTDPGPHLRDRRVNGNVSRISSYPNVRRILTSLLRGLADSGSLVMEGRDIGSLVFPGTPYKFYIDASEEVRASRCAARGRPTASPAAMPRTARGRMRHSSFPKTPTSWTART